MSKPFAINAATRALIALVLLTANVAAPFRTSAIGRTVLGDVSGSLPTCHTVRVRGYSTFAAVPGFRAITGVAKGGSDDDAAPERGPSIWSPLPSPALAVPCQQPAARPSPPLRC
jgi:hypothetical protein